MPPPSRYASENKPSILHPVILPVPTEVADMAPGRRTVELSRHARRALEISAQISGVFLSRAVKDENGVPRPVGGLWWSLSHKPGFVAAVVAPEPVGIDIEKVRAISRRLFSKCASPAEWALMEAEADPEVVFFRVWTAKEAVLKACGTGLGALSGCRVSRNLSPKTIEVTFRGRCWPVEHYYLQDHIAAVVTNGRRVQWTVAVTPFFDF